MAYDNTNAFCEDDDLPNGGHGYLTSAEMDDEGYCLKCKRLRFLLNDGQTFHAVAFGPTWNGFATPIVTRATAEALALDVADFATFTFDEAGVLTVTYHDGVSDDEPTTITPDGPGQYDLGTLGWVFQSPEEG